jgi:hypothetical protein
MIFKFPSPSPGLPVANRPPGRASRLDSASDHHSKYYNFKLTQLQSSDDHGIMDVSLSHGPPRRPRFAGPTRTRMFEFGPGSMSASAESDQPTDSDRRRDFEPAMFKFKLQVTHWQVQLGK